MVNKFKFSSLAQNELEESAEWYEEQLAGLGERFAETIYDAAGTILKNPKSYPSKKRKNREFVVKDFPYIIVYEFVETESIVYILHVFHTSRNPKLKYKK